MDHQALADNLTDQTGQSLILATKFYIPTPRADLVSRPRLVAQLNEGLDGKLIILSAPAGFGTDGVGTEPSRQTNGGVHVPS